MAQHADDEDKPTDAEAAEEQLLKDILEDYDYDFDNWQKIRDEADIDVEYASNNTWNEADKKVRAGRPMLNLDQLSQYRNQVENTVRQNKRGVKVSPAGNGANEQTAELRANRIREIEYQSHAQEAYSQAFSDCLTRSFGFARIVAEYEDEESDNQVFRTKPIANPNQVLPDTDFQSTSGRDWKRCVFLESVSHGEFKRDYPDAKVKDFDANMIASGGRWLNAKRIQIAECWRVIETPNPRGKGRPIREVCMYLTNGFEFLAKKGQPKKHVWKGKYIPFAACLGRIIFKKGAIEGDTEKMILSYIRFARDAAKGYNWTKSTLLEKIALPVKASLLGYDGQVDNDILADIKRATQEHVPWIGFKPVLDQVSGQLLPLPQYGTREPDIQADLLAAEGFQRDIQNALGHFNAQDARLGTSKVTSGLALQELKASGDLGSFDFQDHYDDFLKFMGEQYDDLLGKYDDAAKEVATRLPSGDVKMVAINQMTGTTPQGDPAYKETDARMDLGRHTVTISTGPSSDSQRQAGKDAAMALLGNEHAFPVIASDAVKLMDLGPIGDKMSEDLEFLQPPAMQQARQQKQDGGGPDPRQIQQQNEQLKQQLQHAEEVMKAQHGELEGKQAEIASKEKIAGLQTSSAERLQITLQAMKDATALAVAKINALTKGVVSDGEAQLELVALDHARDLARIQTTHEHVQNELDRQHAVELAARGQQHAVGMAAAGAGVAAESQAAGHDQALEQNQQAADLAPQPEAGA